MVEKFQKPENAGDWLVKKFATTNMNSLFVQAVLDKTHLDFVEPFKHEPNQKDIYTQIEQRINSEAKGTMERNIFIQ